MNRIITNIGEERHCIWAKVGADSLTMQEPSSRAKSKLARLCTLCAPYHLASLLTIGGGWMDRRGYVDD